MKETVSEEIEVKPVTADLSRGEGTSPTQWVFEEHISFRGDSGYSMSAIYGRVKSSIDRALTGSTGRIDNLDLTIPKLPDFQPTNKLVITVKVVTE